jgi:hypothetical protein
VLLESVIVVGLVLGIAGYLPEPLIVLTALLVFLHATVLTDEESNGESE